MAQSRSPVEVADRMSRKRAVLVAVAALLFVVQAVVRPFIGTGLDGGGTRVDWWAINVVLLLALFATGGGLLNSRQLRALVNDEVARDNYRTAVLAGFWVAMVSAMTVYLVPRLEAITARAAVYTVVSAGVSVTLLAFAFLELRAHRDA